MPSLESNSSVVRWVLSKSSSAVTVATALPGPTTLSSIRCTEAAVLSS